jgi:hypothetical protein
LAAGGVVDQPTNAVVGEQGPEAVVPLGGGLREAIARLISMAGDKTFGQGIDERNYTTQRGATPQMAPPKPGGVNWGGQFWHDPASLVAWMNARGANTNVGQFLGAHPGAEAAFGQQGAQQGQAQQRPAQPPRQPSVKAVGLKAAARILNEAAKEHEMDQGTPIQSPPRAVHPAPRPAQRTARPARNIRAIYHS